jgi:hypothetical protein
MNNFNDAIRAAGGMQRGNASGQNQYRGSRGAVQEGDVIPKGYRGGQIQQFTPEQLQLFSQLFSHLGPESYLGRLAGGDESFFNEMEQPAWRLFNQSQGNIASRFSQGGGGQGALGARRGSGFQNASNQYASEFAQDLAAKRLELRRQAIHDLMGFSESLLGQRPTEKLLTQHKHKPSLGEQFLGAAGAGLGGFLGGIGQGVGGALGDKYL